MWPRMRVISPFPVVHKGQRKLHKLVGSMVKMVGLPQRIFLRRMADSRKELPVHIRWASRRGVRERSKRLRMISFVWIINLRLFMSGQVKGFTVWMQKGLNREMAVQITPFCNMVNKTKRADNGFNRLFSCHHKNGRAVYKRRKKEDSPTR